MNSRQVSFGTHTLFRSSLAASRGTSWYRTRYRKLNVDARKFTWQCTSVFLPALARLATWRCALLVQQPTPSAISRIDRSDPKRSEANLDRYLELSRASGAKQT